MKYKAIWKSEPTFELKEGEDLEDIEHDCLMDITMNPHDFIEFIEVEEAKQDFYNYDKPKNRKAIIESDEGIEELN